MNWKIEYTRESMRDISQLETKTVDRILNKLEEVKEDPYHFFKRLVGNDYFKLRIGDYRLLAFLITSDKQIIVQRIGHRKNIYKNF